MGQTIKHFFVEALVAKLAIEALDEAILHRFAGRDIVPGKPALILPFQDRPTGQFAAIVADNGLWLAIEPDQTIQLASDALSRDRGVRNKCQTFACEVIDHGEDTEASSRPERIGDKVEAPALAWPIRDRHRCQGASCTLAASPSLHGKAFFRLEPSQLLLVHDDTLAGQHQLDPAIAKPTPL
jgi:hypothetical protein